ncbi:PilN domain-containing protein [Moorella sulfitireducens]|uniref:PilN domain-containing protein n=1 Tax=Neomoorella sulfitireducens TaxID=2972948 RepID=UPI0021ACC23B|nr:PilN domain-containing protein [Moorella sulfitireducens]
MNTAINLLPPEYRPQRLSLSRGAIIAFTSGGLLLTLYVLFLIQLGITSRRVARLEEQLALYEPRAQQAAAAGNEINEWQQKERELERLVKERRRWQPVLTAINDALPQEIWLVRMEEDGAKGELILAGRSNSLRAIAIFINNLQDSDIWQAVNLQEVKGNGDILNFTIRAVFKDARGDTDKTGAAGSDPVPDRMAEKSPG